MGELASEFASQFFDPRFFVSDLTFACCAVVLLGSFRKKPRTVALRLADFCAIVAADTLVCFAVFAATGATGSMFVFAVLLAAYAALQDRLRTTDKVARCVTFFTAEVSLTNFTGTIAEVFPTLREVTVASWIPNVLSFVALMAVAYFLKRHATSRFRYVPNSYVYLLVGTCLVAIVVCALFIRVESTYQPQLIALGDMEEYSRVTWSVYAVNLVADAALFALLLGSYWMFYVLSSEHDRRADHLVRQRNADSNAEMIEVTRSVYESIREVRHETKNNMAYMRALVDAEDWERVAEFIRSYSEATTAVVNYVQSGNAVIDAAINAKVALANAQGVSVRTMLAAPQDLAFEDEDIYALVANLMDNAIEGALCSGAGEKVVKFSIRPEGGYYFFNTQNPCATGADRGGSLTRLRTTKDDADSHGYGTRVISRIARQYRGMARYQVVNDTFMVNVMLAEPARQDAEDEA